MPDDGPLEMVRRRPVPFPPEPLTSAGISLGGPAPCGHHGDVRGHAHVGVVRVDAEQPLDRAADFAADHGGPGLR